MGSKLSSVVKSREDVLALFDLYRDEGYILTEHEGRFCVSNYVFASLSLSLSPWDYGRKTTEREGTGFAVWRWEWGLLPYILW